MGSPGAGKTSVGRILGGQLGRKVVDIDDDVLENAWAMTVAEKVVVQIFTIKTKYVCRLDARCVARSCQAWGGGVGGRSLGIEGQ